MVFLLFLRAKVGEEKKLLKNISSSAKSLKNTLLKNTENHTADDRSPDGSSPGASRRPYKSWF